ncbi:hypothetical protein [Paraburkholderia sp. J76]|uniref:hypothetical protein n=1 Tax=Paraburkholderia sp. J76 TaxID=2805439 RepID=UPI002ABD98C9|nr:hypothetical protein [Paraburkholderia sp. J76]
MDTPFLVVVPTPEQGACLAPSPLALRAVESRLEAAGIASGAGSQPLRAATFFGACLRNNFFRTLVKISTAGSENKRARGRVQAPIPFQNRVL